MKSSELIEIMESQPQDLDVGLMIDIVGSIAIGEADEIIVTEDMIIIKG